MKRKTSKVDKILSPVKQRVANNECIGVSTRSQRKKVSMLSMPAELLSKILLLVDVEDLRYCRLVCKTFNALICNNLFSQEKIIADFGQSNFVKLKSTGLDPFECIRYFNTNYFYGMNRFGCFSKPFTFRIRKGHICAESYRKTFRNTLKNYSFARNNWTLWYYHNQVDLKHFYRLPWMDDPSCFCVFGRAVKNSVLFDHSEVYGWFSVDLAEKGVPAMVLDNFRPPIAVGMWDPHPNERLGLSRSGLKIRLTNENNEPVAFADCTITTSSLPILHQCIFDGYPKGVRRVIFYGPNSLLISRLGKSDFVGATVKLLTPKELEGSRAAGARIITKFDC